MQARTIDALKDQRFTVTDFKELLFINRLQTANVFIIIRGTKIFCNLNLHDRDCICPALETVSQQSSLNFLRRFNKNDFYGGGSGI